MKPDVPPSYESAISREAWTVIAPYIPSSDLCSACLVSQKWYSIFVPFLWGDPASHFGIANDAVYVALTRFKRTLRKARLSVRSLTHTLHLPPALSEIYGGPNPTWLRDVLENLPNLQSLIVAKLPFFDHHSLLALRTTGLVGRKALSSEEERPPLPTFGLKLLLASGEPNATSLGLTVAIPRFPNLVYLDLSYTTPARDAAVLAALQPLHDLQALKLRGIGLRDGEVEVLANSIGIRVRLLDLRDNQLTDMAVRSLMQVCFLPPDAPPSSRLNVEDWPVGMTPGPDFFSLDTLRSEEFDHELLKQLTRPFTGRLAFEDIPHRGLTHLYISGNHLSVEGISSLLKSKRLHILDGGTVDTVKTITRTHSLTEPTRYTDEVRFPGAEKLVPVLARDASKNLTYLRIDHALVTANTDHTAKEPTRSPHGDTVELAGSAPLSAELPARSRPMVEAAAPAHYPAEMPGISGPIFELDATPAPPRHELIGDLMYFAVSPPVGEKPAESSPAGEMMSPIRGEGPYAPEVVTNGCHSTDHGTGDRVPDPAEISDESSTQSNKSVVFSPVSPMSPHGALNGTMISTSRRPPFAFQSLAAPVPAEQTLVLERVQGMAQILEAPPLVVPAPPPSPFIPRQARIDALLRKRPAALRPPNRSPSDMDRSELSSLHPAALPNLRSLILTNVPLTVPVSSAVIPALKAFISACADESALSRLLAKTNYSLPPGRARSMAEIEHAKSLFALTMIVLEMGQPANSNVKSQRAWEHSRQRLSMSKSSTGDRDSENLWSAAENDFSFFGEEGEEKDECGIYQHDPEKYFPTAHFDDKILLGPNDSDDTLAGTHNPHGGHFPALSPFAMNLARSGTILKSPRDLPLGRNRRSSNESQRSTDSRAAVVEMQGPMPSPRMKVPMSVPTVNEPEEAKLDVVQELAAWRKERKKAYEDELERYRRKRGMNGLPHGTSSFDVSDIDMPFVEGHWKGEVKVVRNAAPKGRTGVVDMYGNYFEKGYLYP